MVPKLVIFFCLQALITLSGNAQEYASSFPCSDCHDKSFKNLKDIKLPLSDNHDDLVFAHHNEIKNCFLCHQQNQPDKLHLRDGTLIGFDQIARLCAQCHGPRFHEWQDGTHGKMKGSWKNPEHVGCTRCHNPHSPKRPTMKAKPAPKIHGSHQSESEGQKGH
ncbi:MAG: hypothetical protein HYV97_16925 [Bdellovibrio sp.]|nr:hypothetical protein [Bdellovibrio sp.]